MGGNKEINGQKCPYSHPRRCKRFCSFGPRGRGGCNRGNECVLHHPKLCNNSLRNSTCFNENCIFVHLKGTKRSRPSRDHSHVRDPHHHSSRDRNPRARYTSQSRAEHPRRDPSPHSGHPHQSTDRRGSRPQTPANYPPRQHDRSPIPAAPVSNNSSEVPFFYYWECFRTWSATSSGTSWTYDRAFNTNNLRRLHLPLRHLHCIITSLLFNSPRQFHSPIAPSSSQSQCPSLDAEYSSILLLNAQSVNSSAQSLCKWELSYISENFLQNIHTNIPILGISESWLKSYITNAQIHIKDYVPIRSDRSIRKGGGAIL